MKYELKDRKKNALMKRDEAVVAINHEGKSTPNRKDVMSEAAKLLKTKPENLVVTKISTSGGSSCSDAKIYVYSKKEDIPEWRVKKFEARIAKIKPPKPLPSENKPAEPKAGEAPAPPAEGEAPASVAEEVKEEAPSEEKSSEEHVKEESPADEKKDDSEEKPKEDKPSSEDTTSGAGKKKESD
jgi:ribosomal protein S24E